MDQKLTSNITVGIYLTNVLDVKKLWDLENYVANIGIQSSWNSKFKIFEVQNFFTISTVTDFCKINANDNWQNSALKMDTVLNQVCIRIEWKVWSCLICSLPVSITLVKLENGYRTTIFRTRSWSDLSSFKAKDGTSSRATSPIGPMYSVSIDGKKLLIQNLSKVLQKQNYVL